ncbi:hypothetical protein C8Q75DRAFT_735069 [Abortiporus biennis]|nr:hypothetical protein C8Q75DRAFT_735069 [Abortiporus biennis]
MTASDSDLVFFPTMSSARPRRKQLQKLPFHSKGKRISQKMVTSRDNQVQEICTPIKKLKVVQGRSRQTAKKNSLVRAKAESDIYEGNESDPKPQKLVKICTPKNNNGDSSTSRKYSNMYLNMVLRKDLMICDDNKQAKKKPIDCQSISVTSRDIHSEGSKSDPPMPYPSTEEYISSEASSQSDNDNADFESDSGSSDDSDSDKSTDIADSELWEIDSILIYLAQRDPCDVGSGDVEDAIQEAREKWKRARKVARAKA